MVLKRLGQLKAFQLSMHSYLRTNDQLCSNQFDITASADQEWDVLAIYFEGWRGKSSLWPVSLYYPGVDIEGLFLYPPIHQSPCWLAGCPRFLAVGLSP